MPYTRTPHGSAAVATLNELRDERARELVRRYDAECVAMGLPVGARWTTFIKYVRAAGANRLLDVLHGRAEADEDIAAEYLRERNTG